MSDGIEERHIRWAERSKIFSEKGQSIRPEDLDGWDPAWADQPERDGRDLYHYITFVPLGQTGQWRIDKQRNPLSAADLADWRQHLGL